MKKTLLILAVLLFSICSLSFGQYFYVPNASPGQNPGGLNTDAENPYANLTGWSLVLPQGTSVSTFSANQTIPFSFNFNGSPVTHYKVSNAGILTFDTASVKNPSTNAWVLPSTLLPEKSVVVWGISGSGANDNIASKTFGTMPNRQHWIYFASYTRGANFTYWSIVLEEGSDKIYVVDQRHGGAVSGLTVGVQIDDTSGTQVAGSPILSAIAGNGASASDNAYYEFIFGTQPDYNFAMENVSLPLYPSLSSAPFAISGEVANQGAATITNFDINYSVNGAAAVSSPIMLVSINSGTSYSFNHPMPWTPSVGGVYTVDVWASKLNNNADQFPGNDTMSFTVIVSDPIPNIIDTYVSNVSVFTTIGNSSDQVSKPMDLDFHPELSRKELWVINQGTENSGGSTVTFENTGEGNQTSVWKQDGNAWHFMSLPSGIAFSENGNFANSPAVFDANHNGGGAFTGPSLWSSDPAIYAQPSGGNGSHLDMLHASSHAMGIAAESGNAFWVMDGFNQDIVWYDFAVDHGPGNADHDDGMIRRVTSFNVKRISENIVSHLALDKTTGWLYIVDGGNKRILRMDTKSGSTSGNPSYGPFEALAQYSNINSVSWDIMVNTGLTEPAGIEVIGDRMIVSDHSNGDIIIYDISNVPAVEIGRINTPSAGIQGLKLGWDGHIWYVNSTTNEVVKIGLGGPVSVDPSKEFNSLTLYPNPTSSKLFLNGLNTDMQNLQTQIFDLTGRAISDRKSISSSNQEINISDLQAGIYILKLAKGDAILRSMKFIVIR